jgi:hypothetical protein
MITEEGKAGRKIGERWSAILVSSPNTVPAFSARRWNTCVGRVAWYWMRRSRYARLPRSRYNCATEIRAKLWYRVSWKV